MIHDAGDLLGAVASGLCVLAASYFVALVWALHPEKVRRRHLGRLLAISLVAAGLAAVISYIANVTWS